MSGLSNHYDTMTAIKSIIDTLSLPGLNTSIIQEVAEYQDGQQSLPFVSISPFGPERTGDELNDRDGVYYGTLICIIGKKNVTSLEQRLGWRQSIRRKLNNTSLSSLGMNYNLKVEPGSVVEPRPFFERAAFVSGMIVRAFFQEPRS